MAGYIMFRGIEVFNTILSVIFNIFGIIGFFQGVEIIKQNGLNISPALFSTLLLISLIYFLSVTAFLILRKFIKKNKLTEKNSKSEIKVLPFILYFIMASTGFPLWFYSSPTQLNGPAQFLTIIFGIIVTTIFIALLTELFAYLSDGKYFKVARKKKDSVSKK